MSGLGRGHRLCRYLSKAGAVVGGVAVLLLAVPAPASAHPLGNFTLNRHSGVVVAPDAITVEHVLDIAEIPTAQRLPTIDSSGDGALSRQELGRWSRPACTGAAADLRLTVERTPVALQVISSRARALPGQAGLPILRLECDLRADVRIEGRTTVRIVDEAATGTVGWREVTAVGDGATLVRSDVPVRSRSKRLTTYPADLLANPLDVSSASLVVRPGGPALATTSGSTTGSEAVLGRGADRLTRTFEGLVSRYDGGPLLALVGVLGAVLLGAAHAVAPGHGKTIMAFYLSGRRQGAFRAAATVAGTVTVTHTAGVLLLGLLVTAGTAFAPAAVYPWLSVVSGLLVLGVGVALLRSARSGHGHLHGTGPGQHSHVPLAAYAGETVRQPALAGAAGPPVGAPVSPSARPGDDHDHGRDHDRGPGHDHGSGHDHDHGSGHDHDHHQRPGHAHEVPEPSPRGLVAIGLAGGLLPSPSALLVLLAAVALGHAWFGVALVVAFGVGMATTLVTIGVLVMRLRGALELRLARRSSRRLAPVLRLAPVVTAVVVTLLGALLALRGLFGTGLF